MSWVDPQLELPEEGRQVAAIYSHWKNEKPDSYEIMFGMAQYSNDDTECVVWNNDSVGKGNWQVGLKIQSSTSFDDIAFAWMYAEDFPLPGWAP